MIEGNDDTGFRHISRRHSYKYEYIEWKKQGNPNELDCPTVFPEKELLFPSWYKIVDAIYRKENLDTKNNKHPDKFDRFLGDYEYDNNKYKCELFLYKNTKIIHTFFLKLNNKVFNKKKPSGFHFVKGKIECTMDFGKGQEILKIPYLNNKNETKYLLEVQWNMTTFKEEWKIIIKREVGDFIVIWRKGEIQIPLNERLQYITVFGLEDVEKEIGKINKMNSEEIAARCN